MAEWPSGQRPSIFFRWRKLGCRFKSRCGYFRVLLFLSSFFYPLPFSLFILTADPVSFARFLGKRISSYKVSQVVCSQVVCITARQENIKSFDGLLRAVKILSSAMIFSRVTCFCIFKTGNSLILPRSAKKLLHFV